MPAAKPQFSCDIAEGWEDAADEGGLLDGVYDHPAHGCQTSSSAHQREPSNPQQQLSYSAAAPALKFDIDDDDDGDDFDLDWSTAQHENRIASNQHASTSKSAAAAAALPAAKPSSAVCMQCSSAPKLQASSHAHSAAPSQPGFQPGSEGPVQKSLPAVSKAQQPQPRKAPNSFKPPRRITSASAAAGADAADGAADREAEVGSHMGGASSKQPLLRLRRAGQVGPHALPHTVPHAVPQAVGKAQGTNEDDGEHNNSSSTTIRVVSLDITRQKPSFEIDTSPVLWAVRSLILYCKKPVSKWTGHDFSFLVQKWGFTSLSCYASSL